MVILDSTYDASCTQPARSGHGFLAAILDGIDDEPLLDRLFDYRRTGRPGYHPRAMLRAYFSKFILKIRYNNQLVERLRGSRKLREVCGFDESVPSESAFSRFLTRLADHQDLLEQALVNAVNELKDLVPAVRHRKDRQPQPLPPLGSILAIDSTGFASYANPNRTSCADPDAAWGVKHSAKAKEGGTDWIFGYKMHLASDAVHGVPLAFTITPANESDSTQLPAVVNKTLDTYPWMKPACLLADRGYDSEPNHRTLFDLGIIPVIHIRKPTAHDGLYDGIYDKKGGPLCLGNVPMKYVRTDAETGHHLFRCQAGGCSLLGQGLVPNCHDQLWLNPEDNLRVIGVLPRSSRAWGRLYSMRMSIERVYRSLKHSRGLEGHCVMGMRKILLLATTSVLTFLMTSLARLKLKQPDRMRQMTVKVA